MRAGPSEAELGLGIPALKFSAVPMGLRPTNRDENRRGLQRHPMKWCSSGRGRKSSGEVEADLLSDPERALEQMSVRRHVVSAAAVVRDRAQQVDTHALPEEPSTGSIWRQHTK
jgi:hypothetical protein